LLSILVGLLLFGLGGSIVLYGLRLFRCELLARFALLKEIGIFQSIRVGVDKQIREVREGRWSHRSGRVVLYGMYWWLRSKVGTMPDRSVNGEEYDEVRENVCESLALMGVLLKEHMSLRSRALYARLGNAP
jgi:hypothetical protein